MQPQSPTVNTGLSEEPTNMPLNEAPRSTAPPLKFISPLRPSRKLALILVTILLLGGGLLWYSLFRQTPERQLEAALKTSLSTKTLMQEWQGTSFGSQVNIKARSDFSNPRQTKVDVSVQTSYNKNAVELGYDLISLPGDEAYARYTKYKMQDFANATAAEKLLQNKWLTLKDATALAAMGHLDQAINTPLGEVITGNFDAKLRREILQKINQDKIYTIKSSQEIVENRRQLLKLDLTINKDKLTSLNNLVADRLGIDKPDFSQLSAAGSIFIDTKTNQIIRAQTSQEGRTMTINYSQFNQPLTIKKPQPVLSAEESDALLKQVAELVLGRSL